MTEMPVRVGVNFDGFVTTGEAIALAQRAVDAGARSLWVAEHLGYREAIATCMAFALKAPGPILVPTAVSPYLWHPTPTAMAMATLDGRADAPRSQSAWAIPVPSGIGPRGRTAGPRHGQFTEALRKLWAGGPSTSTASSSRWPAPGWHSSRARRFDLHRRDGPRHAAAGGHRRRHEVLSAGLSTATVRASIALCAEGAAGTDAISPRSAAPDICSSASRVTPGRPSTLVRQKLAFVMRSKFLAANIKASALPSIRGGDRRHRPPRYRRRRSAGPRRSGQAFGIAGTQRAPTVAGFIVRNKQPVLGCSAAKLSARARCQREFVA